MLVSKNTLTKFKLFNLIEKHLNLKLIDSFYFHAKLNNWQTL